MIGLGTFRADDKDTLLNAVKHAIKAGYYFSNTHIPILFCNCFIYALFFLYI
jgi:hypothetical protein